MAGSLLLRHPGLLDLPFVRQFILDFYAVYGDELKARTPPTLFCVTDELTWLATRASGRGVSLRRQFRETVEALGTMDPAAARDLVEESGRWVAWVRPSRRPSSCAGGASPATRDGKAGT
jgi:hypothetical protein